MNNTPFSKMRQKPVREIMTVTDKQFISPQYIRVFLTGRPDTIANIATMTVGANNKILLPVDKSRDIDPGDSSSFIRRTYTHRGVDESRQHIWIDFVVHGDEAPASGWASHAQVGDRLGLMMKPKTSTLHPAVENLILAGDATAIPVLGAILEALPAAVKGECIIEVHGKEDEQDLPTAAEINIKWLHNPNPMQGSQLAETFKSLELPEAEQSRFAYVAGEFASVKDIRQYLRYAQEWSRDEFYAFSYWKSGAAEDKSADDRRAEKNAA